MKIFIKIYLNLKQINKKLFSGQCVHFVIVTYYLTHVKVIGCRDWRVNF